MAHSFGDKGKKKNKLPSNKKLVGSESKRPSVELKVRELQGNMRRSISHFAQLRVVISGITMCCVEMIVSEC
jgi:hypothetical protein